jgi:hypothetical protein
MSVLADEVWFALLGESAKELCVPVSRTDLVRRSCKRLLGVLADGLEHSEAHCGVESIAPCHETAVHQRCESVKDLELEFLPTYCLGSLEGPSAGENGQPSKESALLCIEEVVAPLDRSEQRPLANGHVFSITG